MTKKALIIIDLQNDYYEGGKFPLVNVNEATNNAVKILNAAREKQEEYIIIHVRHEFPGDPDNAPFFGRGTEGSQINELVKNQSDEIVITKNEVNSFLGTNLKQVLDENRVKDIVIIGAMSNLCVQGAARDAYEKGYNVTVVHDAVASRDVEFGGVTVPAKYVAATVFATLSFGFAKLITTEEQLSSF